MSEEVYQPPFEHSQCFHVSDVADTTAPEYTSKPECYQLMLNQLRMAASANWMRCAECWSAKGPAYLFYRCLYCGLFYCNTCAEKHFGMTRKEYFEKGDSPEGK